MCVQCPQRSQDGIRSSVAGTTDGYKLPLGAGNQIFTRTARADDHWSISLAPKHLFNICIFVYECFAYKNVGKTCACRVLRGQMRASDSLELNPRLFLKKLKCMSIHFRHHADNTPKIGFRSSLAYRTSWSPGLRSLPGTCPTQRLLAVSLKSPPLWVMTTSLELLVQPAGCSVEVFFPISGSPVDSCLDCLSFTYVFLNSWV